ncbi:MAG: hypothetical protein R3A48_17305 [Polyangiales bacterium]
MRVAHVEHQRQVEGPRDLEVRRERGPLPREGRAGGVEGPVEAALTDGDHGVTARARRAVQRVEGVAQRAVVEVGQGEGVHAEGDPARAGEVRRERARPVGGAHRGDQRPRHPRGDRAVPHHVAVGVEGREVEVAVGVEGAHGARSAQTYARSSPRRSGGSR